MDKLSESRRSDGSVDDPAEAPKLQAVLQQVKLELVSARVSGRERGGKGFDPYDSRLGRPLRSDVWGRRRRPA